MTDRTLHVADALLGPEYLPSGPAEIDIENGRIAAIHTGMELPSGRRLLAMPALADAHNHGRPLSSTSFGAGLKPLETWLPNLALMPPVDAYLATAASFGRSVRGGCVGAMVHLTRPMGKSPLPDEARDIARAASNAGLFIGFAVAMRNRNPMIYGDHAPLLKGLPDDTRATIEKAWLAPPPDPKWFLDLVDEVADAVADQPHVDVQYGPNGVQWCTDGFLEAIAQKSAETGRRVHMHLLETRPQRDWADRTYPQGIVQHLADIGLLSPRLTLAHCVWARPDELDLISAHGARISVNPSSNLHLSSGIAPVPEMMKKGVAVGMGLDGCAFDEDDDGLRELRLFRHLNAGWGFTDGVTPSTALKAACTSGRASIGMEAGGVLAVGAPADVLLMNLDTLDRDNLMPVDSRHYLFTRACQGDIVELMSAGRTLLANGRLPGLDLHDIEAELRAQYRVGLAKNGAVRDAYDALEPMIADFYKGCC